MPTKASRYIRTAFSCLFICCTFTGLEINFTFLSLYTQFLFWGKANDCQRMAENGLKGWLCHGTCYLFKKLNLVFSSTDFQNKSSFCYLTLSLSIATLTKFLLSVATDGKGGNGLKLEKVGPTFSTLMLCIQAYNNNQKNNRLVLHDEIC